MLLGFKKRFAPPIKIGTKVFTMRGKRKREPKIGETLYMYTGLRTKYVEFICKNEKLISKQKANITINRSAGGVFGLEVKVDRRKLSLKELDRFVKFDGFIDTIDFINFWIENTKDKKGKKHKKGKLQIKATLTIYHWTDLRF